MEIIDTLFEMPLRTSVLEPRTSKNLVFKALIVGLRPINVFTLEFSLILFYLISGANFLMKNTKIQRFRM